MARVNVGYCACGECPLWVYMSVSTCSLESSVIGAPRTYWRCSMMLRLYQIVYHSASHCYMLDWLRVDR